MMVPDPPQAPGHAITLACVRPPARKKAVPTELDTSETCPKAVRYGSYSCGCSVPPPIATENTRGQPLTKMALPWHGRPASANQRGETSTPATWKQRTKTHSRARRRISKPFALSTGAFARHCLLQDPQPEIL